MIDREIFCNLMQNELGVSSEISEQFLEFLNDAGLVIMPSYPDESLLTPSTNMMKIGTSVGAWKTKVAGNVTPFVFHYRCMVEWQRKLFGLPSVFDTKKMEKTQI